MGIGWKNGRVGAAARLLHWALVLGGLAELFYRDGMSRGSALRFAPNGARKGVNCCSVSLGGERGGPFKLYVWKILRALHPGMGVSSRSMCILDSFVADVLSKLFGEAVALSRYAGRQTVSSRDMRSSAKLVLP